MSKPGKFNIEKYFILTNHSLLLGKFYIYSRRCQNSLPTLRGFIARPRHVYNIELDIAREKNKLLKHFQKWEELILKCTLILTMYSVDNLATMQCLFRFNLFCSIAVFCCCCCCCCFLIFNQLFVLVVVFN